MVVLQHATESFAALDFTSDGTNILIRLDEFIAEALMVSLGVVMLDVYAYGVPKPTKGQTGRGATESTKRPCGRSAAAPRPIWSDIQSECCLADRSQVPASLR